jgi:adenylate cyclase class 2
MNYEVEQKHRIEDVAKLLSALSKRGLVLGATIEQEDRYFAHPCRDFAKTDEALRIRTVGGHGFVTYKGPKLDTTTKTRHELELPLDPNDADGSQFAELLGSLGFSSVATVRKQRRLFQIARGDRLIEGALDDVEGLGTFVELELHADEGSLDEARRLVATVAAELELGPSERRSYLEMLLEKRRPRDN